MFTKDCGGKEKRAAIGRCVALWPACRHRCFHHWCFQHAKAQGLQLLRYWNNTPGHGKDLVDHVFAALKGHAKRWMAAGADAPSGVHLMILGSKGMRPNSTAPSVGKYGFDNAVPRVAGLMHTAISA